MDSYSSPKIIHYSSCHCLFRAFIPNYKGKFSDPPEVLMSSQGSPRKMHIGASPCSRFEVDLLRLMNVDSRIKQNRLLRGTFIHTLLTILYHIIRSILALRKCANCFSGYLDVCLQRGWQNVLVKSLRASLTKLRKRSSAGSAPQPSLI